MIDIVSGSRTIGGNCVVVHVNKDEYVVLDHGLRFSVFRKYYGMFTQPLDAQELRFLKALPPFDVMLNAKAVFISHLHLDHLGSLDYLDLMKDSGVNVYVPFKDYYVEVLLEYWRHSWKSVLIPHTSYSKTLLVDVEQNTFKYVKPIKVYHSAHPSYSYVVESYEGTVVYTGDLRTYSLLNNLRYEPLAEEVYSRLYGSIEYDALETIAQNVDSVDALIIEGTNFGRVLTPLEPKEFIDMADKIIVSMPSLVSLHILDLESLMTLALLAYRNGLSTILHSPRLARFSTYAINPRILRELNVCYTGKRPLPSVDVDFLPLTEALNEMMLHKGIIVTDYESIDIARLLLRYSPSKPIAAVIVSSEPTAEEYSIEMKRQLKWFRLAKILPYRLRVSGHYYPHELSRILKLLKPKKIIPIHTTHPELVTAFNNFHYTD